MAGGLKRRRGPGLLIAYGVGVMVGAGSYVLTGAAAGAAVIAALTGAKGKRPEAPIVAAAAVPWIGMAGCILPFAAAIWAWSG